MQLPELKFIGSKNPIIIALGRDTYNILKEDERLKNGLKKVKQVKHYSCYISQEDFKKEFEKIDI